MYKCVYICNALVPERKWPQVLPPVRGRPTARARGSGCELDQHWILYQTRPPATTASAAPSLSAPPPSASRPSMYGMYLQTPACLSTPAAGGQPAMSCCCKSVAGGAPEARHSLGQRRAVSSARHPGFFFPLSCRAIWQFLLTVACGHRETSSGADTVKVSEQAAGRPTARRLFWLVV